MLSRCMIWRRASAISLVKPCQRYSSFQAVHTSFPATMYRFQLQRESSLFDNKLKMSNGAYMEDCVKVADDGLIYPKLIDAQNAPIFRPNTCLLQEILRNHYDFYEEEAELSGDVIDPQVVCIKKGTSIPASLQLVRRNDQSSEFSLQPSHPMTLNDLNNALNGFYSNSALITGAVEWMERNEFQDAFSDSASEDWMKS